MDSLPEDKTAPFDLQDFIFRYKFFVLILLIALILIGVGAIYLKGGIDVNSTKIEVISPTTEPQATNSLVVEVNGAVEKPGVYKLPSGSRVEDALVAAGGLAVNADRNLVERTINRAAKITDGQKIYIPEVNDHSVVLSATTNGADQTASSALGGQTSGLVNINTATLNQLDALPGIGPVYAQRIIDNRPYSDINELLSKKILTKSTFEKIKDKISIY